MAPSRKLKLAVVANSPSPYRMHQHLRIAREMADDVELWSLFLHEHNWQPWTSPLPEEIRPVLFGRGESITQKKSLRGWLKQWGKAGRVIDWLKAHEVDAVITTGYNDPGLMRLIAWCRRAGVPNFMFGDSNVHADRVRGFRKLIKRWYVGWVLRRVTGLMPCGIYGRRYFEPYGGGDKPWFYMPHEPDYARIFAVTPADRDATQIKYGLRPDRRYFMYSGRLVPVKRVDTLIDAFARLAAARPDWDLLIVGGGPLEAELKARVPAELTSRVVWTGFINDVDELSRLYTCGDVFILPSSYEPWAVVVCEAAAAGLPIVASHVVGAAGELCREGSNGRLFTAGDVGELTDALLEVTATDEHLAALSRGSLEVLDDWRRRGDPVQGVKLALAHVGLLPPPPPIEPQPPTPRSRPAYT
jgi:glycosyltransferase involved in cell wall biosynthesis